MPMSALRRLLCIAAIASEARETTPNEAANLAANEQLSTLNPPEVEHTGTQGDDAGQDAKANSCRSGSAVKGDLRPGGGHYM
jgi:hypothetical protein